MGRWRERDSPHKGSEADARQDAEQTAARLEAMGSIYDPRDRRWSPIRLRINPPRGEKRREARDAIRLAIGTGGGSYDSQRRLYTIDNPGAGSAAYLLQLAWDQHYYEAVPFPNPTEH